MVKKADEIQNYIEQIIARRSRGSYFDYETCQEILEHAAEMNSDAIFGIGYYYFAEYYWNEDDNEKTMYCLGECTKCFRMVGMYEFLARSYNMMGAVSVHQDNLIVALNYYYTGLQYAEKYGLQYEHAMLDTNIGYILVRMRRYREAAERYEHALKLYEQSEDSYHYIFNLALVMTYSGICYLKLQYPDRAFALWDKLEKLQQEFPDRIFPEIDILIFQAECVAAHGTRDKLCECMDGILERLRGTKDIGKVGDCLLNIAELLWKFQEYERLDEFFRIIDARGLEKQLMLAMDLYSYRSTLLLHENRTEEYLQLTRSYFAAFEQDRQNNRQLTARVIELRDKLKSMTKEREQILAYNRHLENIALYDSMTNLANRTFLNEYTSEKFGEAQRENKLLGVELLDIDSFKKYNDTYGHLMGDVCIEAVADILRSVCSEKVFCSRYGGDEFMIIYSGLSVEEIRQTVEEIQQRVRALAIPHRTSECSNILTVSQGVFVRRPEEMDREWDFNAQADIALYHAKRDGRNRCRIHTEYSQI